MSITATVDGTNYSDIETITTGGKTITLTESGGGGGSLPTGVAEIKSGSFSPENDITSGNKEVEHGCSGTPDIIEVWSDYRTRYTPESKPANTTMVGFHYNSKTAKGATSVGTSYEGNAQPSTMYNAQDSADGEGLIISVDSTKFTIKNHSTRRLGGGLTYKWIAVRLS